MCVTPMSQSMGQLLISSQAPMSNQVPQAQLVVQQPNPVFTKSSAISLYV